MPDFTIDDDASSSGEEDELMDDAGEVDDGEGEEDADDEENDEDDEDGGEDEEQQVTSGPTSHPALIRTSASPQPSAPQTRIRLEVRAEALTASSYDIVPTIAAPQSTSINAITATPDFRYWFSGGADGYIRKYDGPASINGKTLLTVAQRHPFVDSVVKAGVLMTYWDNEEPPVKGRSLEGPLSSVYSLAVHSQALWILSGMESGAVNLYSVRHQEGHRMTCLQKHKSAVSVLTLARDERSVLSGSWDKNIFDWDLETGQVKRSFEGSGGQIAAIEVRPASTLPVPEESGEHEMGNRDTRVFTNGATLTNGANGINGHGPEDGNEDAPGSPSNDSLFGGGSDANSLFGETAADNAPSGGHFGDEDDEFSRAMMASSMKHEDAQGDITMADARAQDETTILDPNSSTIADTSTTSSHTANSATAASQSNPVGVADSASQNVRTNGALHLGSATDAAPEAQVADTQDAVATSDSTFLAASIDGTLRVWDRRQPNPIARIQPKTGVPPWCMAACWSPDGNYIYAGRRNGMVEEFSLHKGLKTPERTFKFPQGSNAVTAMKAMPNGRHLICASHDILRLYDLKQPQSANHSKVPFLIVPGPPRAGVISALHIDPTCRYMLSAAGNRGWEGSNTEVLIGYEIGIPS